MRNNAHDDKETRFDAAAEAILNETEPDVFSNLSMELRVTYDSSNPERLLELYKRAGTLETKLEFAKLAWFFFRSRKEREKGFFFLLDVLNLQLGDTQLRTILKQHPLLSPFNLTSAECDVVVAVLVKFLEDHPPIDWNIVGERFSYEYLSELPNNEFAARLLVVLYEYPATSKGAKEYIGSRRDVAVFYYLSDVEHYSFDVKTIDDYLKRRIY